VRREILYDILVDFITPINLERLIICKMCLNDTYSNIRIGKILFDVMLYRLFSQLWFRICHREGQRKSGRTGSQWNTSASVLN
jgi:hypothetical protein